MKFDNFVAVGSPTLLLCVQVLMSVFVTSDEEITESLFNNTGFLAESVEFDEHKVLKEGRFRLTQVQDVDVQEKNRETSDRGTSIGLTEYNFCKLSSMIRDDESPWDIETDS